MGTVYSRSLPQWMLDFLLLTINCVLLLLLRVYIQVYLKLFRIIVSNPNSIPRIIKWTSALSLFRNGVNVNKPAFHCPCCPRKFIARVY